MRELQSSGKSQQLLEDIKKYAPTLYPTSHPPPPLAQRISIGPGRGSRCSF